MWSFLWPQVKEALNTVPFGVELCSEAFRSLKNTVRKNLSKDGSKG